MPSPTQKLACLAAAVALTGCSQCSSPFSRPAPPANSAESSQAAGGAAPKPDLALEVSEPKTGTGAVAEDGKTVSILYRATFTDGSQFDQRLSAASPLTFKLGAHAVITGLEVGLKGMRVGSRRRLVIPPTMAYGAQGFGEVVPPGTPVVFEVELIKVE